MRIYSDADWHRIERGTWVLEQERYIDRQFGSSKERMQRIQKIAEEFWTMSPDCRLSVCIPAYKEAGIITNTLKNYTLFQTFPDGTPFDPALFEINILVNRPNPNREHDRTMMDEILEFRRNHPQYHINLAEVTYNFEKKPVIWLIFKDIVDAVILRNLSRLGSEEQKSKLIIRTAWADVEALNPIFISRTLKAFSQPWVIAHRGETRLPPELLQSFPLLHVIQTLWVYLLRQYHGSYTTNWPFSYTAEAYAHVDWFNREKILWEEIDLARRLLERTKTSKHGERFIRDCIKDVLNNPRRQVHAILAWSKLSERYQKFWEQGNEDAVRDLSISWRNIRPELLPDSCALTPGNLSREVSAYYRTYIRIAISGNVDMRNIDSLFRKWFRLSGIHDYAIHNTWGPAKSHIIIENIDPLLDQMRWQRFWWVKGFTRYSWVS